MTNYDEHLKAARDFLDTLLKRGPEYDNELANTKAEVRALRVDLDQARAQLAYASAGSVRIGGAEPMLCSKQVEEQVHAWHTGLTTELQQLSLELSNLRKAMPPRSVIVELENAKARIAALTEELGEEKAARVRAEDWRKHTAEERDSLQRRLASAEERLDKSEAARIRSEDEALQHLNELAAIRGNLPPRLRRVPHLNMAAAMLMETHNEARIAKLEALLQEWLDGYPRPVTTLLIKKTQHALGRVPTGVSVEVEQLVHDDGGKPPVITITLPNPTGHTP